jgi:hypothetical protein
MGLEQQASGKLVIEEYYIKCRPLKIQNAKDALVDAFQKRIRLKFIYCLFLQRKRRLKHGYFENRFKTISF